MLHYKWFVRKITLYTHNKRKALHFLCFFSLLMYLFVCVCVCALYAGVLAILFPHYKAIYFFVCVKVSCDNKEVFFFFYLSQNVKSKKSTPLKNFSLKFCRLLLGLIFFFASFLFCNIDKI